MSRGRYGLSDTTSALLGDAKLRSPEAWAELLDQGAAAGADALGLEPAQRDLLVELCASEGAVTAQEQVALRQEAKELNELVVTLEAAAVAAELVLGDPVRVEDVAATVAAAAVLGDSDTAGLVERLAEGSGGIVVGFVSTPAISRV